jgi:hypothetical protein
MDPIEKEPSRKPPEEQNGERRRSAHPGTERTSSPESKPARTPKAPGASRERPEGKREPAGADDDAKRALDEELDEELDDSFPASDPPSLTEKPR